MSDTSATQLLTFLIKICQFPTTLGALGGFSLFLWSLRKGHYKNNKLIRKFLIELSGAALLATIIGPLFPAKAIIIGSFFTGLTWVEIIQVMRSKFTKTVKALLSEEFK